MAHLEKELAAANLAIWAQSSRTHIVEGEKQFSQVVI